MKNEELKNIISCIGDAVYFKNKIAYNAEKAKKEDNAFQKDLETLSSEDLYSKSQEEIEEMSPVDVEGIRETFNKTYKEIDSYGITRIEMDGYIVIITLKRPGVFIGVRGSNINYISEHLKKEIDERLVIHIKEEKYLDYLYPPCYLDYDENDEYDYDPDGYI